MWNVTLAEAQAIIKIAGRNINNADTQMAPPLWQKNKEELKSLLMKVKEEIEKPDLKLIIQNTKNRHPLPSLHRKQMGEQWKQWQTSFLGAPKLLQMVTVVMKLRQLLLGRKSMTNLDSV